MIPPGAGKTAHDGRTQPTWRELSVLLFVVALTLTVLGCVNIRSGDVEVQGIAEFKVPAFPETGANKVQIFTEMHYQPSFRSQEGPRLLPPPDSVPVSGRELRYSSLEEYRGLAVPGTVSRAYDPAKAAKLYDINCTVCHGSTLKGNAEEDGSKTASVLKYMVRGPFPADLTAPLTKDTPDGELFAFISKGGRQGYAAIERGRESSSPMPEFQRLLTEEERWALVLYVRSMQ